MIDGHVTDVESIHSTTQPLVCNYKMKYSDGIKPQGLDTIFLSIGNENEITDFFNLNFEFLNNFFFHVALFNICPWYILGLLAPKVLFNGH